MAEPANETKKTLYLIDGHHQFFRAYFAIRGGMTSPVTGEPTNAVFAYTAMLLKLFKDYRPTHVALIIDTPEPTFRNELYPDYKGQRDDPPDDFAPQIPRMIELTEKFGIPVLGQPGAEADDIMATLAVQLTAADPDLYVRLVSKDKDLDQVLSDRVSLFDVQEGTEMDAAALEAKKGITPQIAVDYQALIGDTADNVPGVKGIGPKTASKLLNQFGSLDALVAGVDQLKGKQKDNIEAGISSGQLELSRKLVTLMRDLDVPFSAEDAAVSVSAIQAKQLAEDFRNLGFNRHPRDLAELVGDDKTETDVEPPAPAKQSGKDDSVAGFGLFAAASDDDASEAGPPKRDGSYRCIRTLDELNQVVADIREAGFIAVDTETVGLGHRADLCGVCLSWEEGAGVYVPTRSPEPDQHLDPSQVIEALRAVLEDPAIAKFGHHFKYDLHVLCRAGCEVHGRLFDSMIAAFLCNAPGIGMDDLALAELQYRCVPITEIIGPKPRRKSDPPQKTMDQIPLDAATVYSAEDADITLRLCRLFEPRCEQLGVMDLARDVEMPLVSVLHRMEAAGIKVDPDVLEQQRTKLDQRAQDLRQEVLDRAGHDFSPDSPKQLGELLFTTLGFPVQKKTKTGYSTDAEVLDKLSDLGEDELAKVPEQARPIPGLMVEYRMLTKLVGTYFVQLTEAIEEDGRVHGTFHQTGAATGRLSSSNPNLQNIPIRTDVGREIRRAFVAEPGQVLIAADYSQIELRILAHLSQDPALLEAFRNDHDIHAAVAAEVFEVPLDQITGEQRSHAKMINFGIVYGITAFGLARRVESLDQKAAAELIASYKRRFAGIEAFLQQCIEEAREHGFVRTMLGRRREIAEIETRNPQRRALAERLAINSVVQGSAADLIKKAMVDLQAHLDADYPDARMLLQIHDELVVECPEASLEAVRDVVVRTMENAMSLDVPLRVDANAGPDWFAAK
ncbi:MAG: DNA polymerase I [Planctomycetota bacterium]